MKKLDVILDNLRTDVGKAQVFLHKPMPIQAHMNEERKMFSHNLQQRAHNYANQNSNPYWSSQGMYENQRQKKMKGLLACMKHLK